MDLVANDFIARNLSKINILMGRNGSGKSSMLTGLDAVLRGGTEWRVAYITPERGGNLEYMPNVEQNSLDESWVPTTRRKNQFAQFREQTVVQYRRLELAVLRRLEDSVVTQGEPVDAQMGFKPTMNMINGLLENIEIRRGDTGAFTLHSRKTQEAIAAEAISSGEAELISLAIEVFIFAVQSADKSSVLLLDEPDVHLHPDLQARLMRLIQQLVNDYGFTVVIATHSTPILAALNGAEELAVGFISAGQKDVTFRPVSEAMRAVLPVFGAHPLSQVFNEAPILLVEGDDDVRVWQQATRTAEGALKLFPVACGGLSTLPAFEQSVVDILASIYDNPVGYSLRDRDESPEDIQDLQPLIRMRLSCRAAENLLLTDEVLTACGTTWLTVLDRMKAWLATGLAHPRRNDLQAFVDQGADRKGYDLKELRMLLVGEFLASSRPWEVLVGQSLGQLSKAGTAAAGPGSLVDFLGSATVNHIFPNVSVS